MSRLRAVGSSLVGTLYWSNRLGLVVPTLHSCLLRELVGMDSVLDLGCGPASPMGKVAGGWKVGVEGDNASAQIARDRGTHDVILCGDISSLCFPERSFDAVVLLEVIEHLPHHDGERLLENAFRWARSKVIVSTPNGFWPQGPLGGNELQRHLSGWTLAELRARGMRVVGLAGARALRKENQGIDDPRVTEFAATLRGKPWQLMMLFAAATQIVTYRVPRFAFELFAVFDVRS